MFVERFCAFNDSDFEFRVNLKRLANSLFGAGCHVAMRFPLSLLVDNSSRSSVFGKSIPFLIYHVEFGSNKRSKPIPLLAVLESSDVDSSAKAELLQRHNISVLTVNRESSTVLEKIEAAVGEAYQKFGSNEQSQVHRLLSMLDNDEDVAVLEEVKLADVIRPGGYYGELRSGVRDFISKTSIDIVLFRKFDVGNAVTKWEPVLSIEYDGRQHEDDLQKKKDDTKNMVCSIANIPMIRLNRFNLPYDEKFRYRSEEEELSRIFQEDLLCRLVRFFLMSSIQKSIDYDDKLEREIDQLIVRRQEFFNALGSQSSQGLDEREHARSEIDPCYWADLDMWLESLKEYFYDERYLGDRRYDLEKALKATVAVEIEKNEQQDQVVIVKVDGYGELYSRGIQLRVPFTKLIHRAYSVSLDDYIVLYAKVWIYDYLATLIGVSKFDDYWATSNTRWAPSFLSE